VYRSSALSASDLALVRESVEDLFSAIRYLARLISVAGYDD